MALCLYCYQNLENEQTDFHAGCSKKIFDKSIPPIFPYTDTQILELAEKAIKSQITVTGVQPKLSLEVEKNTDKNIPQKFTIVGLWGHYILKPPASNYPYLPEIEDLTMHLAHLSDIKTVPHSLIKLQSGKLAYITRRVDRTKQGKLAMEDMCQLTERLTEYKYRGSYEQIGKAILKYATNPGLEIVNFFEQLIFSFLTGNADMHLKNFSLLHQPYTGYILCPAYDMVASSLVVPDDKEELALTLNGKKAKLRQKDFVEVMTQFRINQKAQQHIFNRFVNSFEKWQEFIEVSFLSQELKDNYQKLIVQKAKQLEIYLK